MNSRVNEIYQDLKLSLKLGQSSVDSVILELAKIKDELELFSQKMKILEANQKIRDVLLPNLGSLYSGRKKVDISCDSKLTSEQGFYPIEYSQNGKCFRWTGPTPSFFFDIHIDRTIPIEFVIKLQKVETDNIRQLRCFVDNIEVPLVYANNINAAVIEYSAVLMPRSFLGLTRLEFRVGSMFHPEGNEDARKLGVVFLELHLGEVGEEAVKNYLNKLELLSQ